MPVVIARRVEGTLLFGNPDDDEPPVAQRGDGRVALVIADELVHRNSPPSFWPVGESTWAYTSCRLVEAAWLKLAQATTTLPLASVATTGLTWAVVGERVYLHVPGQPEIARRQEARVNALKSLPPTLPDEHRPTAVQQRDLRVLLVARAGRIHAKGGQRPSVPEKLLSNRSALMPKPSPSVMLSSQTRYPPDSTETQVGDEPGLPAKSRRWRIPRRW